VTILDAYAVIDYLRGEPAAPQVRTLLESGEGVLTAIGLAEVLDHLVRLATADEEGAKRLPWPAVVGGALILSAVVALHPTDEYPSPA
jgi:hypothetical protein